MLHPDPRYRTTMQDLQENIWLNQPVDIELYSFTGVVGKIFASFVHRIRVTDCEVKVPISWLGILHIYNIWNPVIRIAIYLAVRTFYLRGLFGC